MILRDVKSGRYLIMEFKTHWSLKSFIKGITKESLLRKSLDKLLEYYLQVARDPEYGGPPDGAFLVHVYVSPKTGEAVAVAFEMGKPSKQTKLTGWMG